MFFKKNNPIEFTNKIIKKSRVPILIYDKQWKQLFSDKMNKTMENLSRDLEKLIEEEKVLEKNLKDYQHRKRILMNKIIHLSARLNIKGEEVNVLELDGARSEIANINHEIDRIREDLQIYPRKIEDLNLQLLKETTKIAYLEIDRAEDRMKVVDKEISLLRERLGQYWDEREGLEDRAQSFYSLLHSIIGSEEIERLDKKFLKEKEND